MNTKITTAVVLAFVLYALYSWFSIPKYDGFDINVQQYQTVHPSPKPVSPTHVVAAGVRIHPRLLHHPRLHLSHPRSHMILRSNHMNQPTTLTALDILRDSMAPALNRMTRQERLNLESRVILTKRPWMHTRALGRNSLKMAGLSWKMVLWRMIRP